MASFADPVAIRVKHDVASGESMFNARFVWTRKGKLREVGQTPMARDIAMSWTKQALMYPMDVKWAGKAAQVPDDDVTGRDDRERARMLNKLGAAEMVASTDKRGFVRLRPKTAPAHNAVTLQDFFNRILDNLVVDFRSKNLRCVAGTRRRSLMF